MANAYCYGCGSILNNIKRAVGSILICSECLDHDCEKFEELASINDKEEIPEELDLIIEEK